MMFRCVFLFLAVFVTFLLKGQIIVETKKTPEELVTLLLGVNSSGIQILDASFIGAPKAIGVFNTFSDEFPIKSGIVLSTGVVSDIDGPNQQPNSGTALFMEGDKQLENIVQSKTADAAVLEFTFVANTNEISFKYMFASEEYPEYVNKGVNDVFAFLIDGYGYEKPENIALIPGTKQVVSVDNINANNNSGYYLENPRWNLSNPVFQKEPFLAALSYNCEFDGLTVPLLAKAKVTPYQRYVMKIAIADVGDNIYDTGVILKKNSLKNSGEKEAFEELLKRRISEISDSIQIIDITAENNSVNIISNIQFEFDSYEIADDFIPFLDNLAEIFIEYFDMHISIEGYSDDIGDVDYNLQLSELRAKQVYAYLVSKDVPDSCLSFVGNGNKKPLIKSMDEEARKKNRRVEFIISR